MLLPSRIFPHSIPLPERLAYRTIKACDVFPWVWSLFCDIVYSRGRPFLCGVFDYAISLD